MSLTIDQLQGNQSIEEPEFAELIVRTRSNPKHLVPMLREQHSIYKGKSGNAVSRMRGFIYYSFYLTTLPEDGLGYILEELESSKDAYTIAAAAMALRKSLVKRTEMSTFLTKSLLNVYATDNYFSFSNYYQGWPLREPTSAIREILSSLGWLGRYAKPSLTFLRELESNPNRRLSPENINLIRQTISVISSDNTEIADCCDNFERSVFGSYSQVTSKNRSRKAVSKIVLEDHDGNAVKYGDFFSKRFTLVAFFYTRCDNPLKCSLTISNLAEIQNRAHHEKLLGDLNIAAISYDSYYDRPEKIKSYVEARGLKFNEHNRAFRVPTDFQALKEFFDLGVNYTDETVNRHIIELYLLNTRGEVIMNFRRGQMNNDEIVKSVRSAIEKDKKNVTGLGRLKAFIKTIWSVAMPVLILLLPKCPLCFAAYFSMLGIASIQLMPYVKFIFPALVVLMAINFYALYKMGVSRNTFLPLYLCLGGSSLVVSFGYFIPFQPGSILGLSILLLGAALNSLPYPIYLKLKMKISSLRSH